MDPRVSTVGLWLAIVAILLGLWYLCAYLSKVIRSKTFVHSLAKRYFPHVPPEDPEAETRFVYSVFHPDPADLPDPQVIRDLNVYRERKNQLHRLPPA